MLNSNSTPLLSVIVPNYNNEEFLSECLDSILQQTYKNLEIVVSDDASTDGSVSIIEQYVKASGGVVRGLFHKVNRGVAANRHLAILESRGDYLTTLDSDDYYCDNRKLEKEMAIVLGRSEKLTRNICAFSNIITVDIAGETLQVVGTSDTIREGSLFDGIITRDCFVPRDFVFPKAAYFEVGGFDQSLRVYEDWDLKIRLAAKYEFYYSGIDGIAYRQHGEGLSACSLPEHVEMMKKVFRKNISLCEKQDEGKLIERFEAFITSLSGGQEGGEASPVRGEAGGLLRLIKKGLHLN